MSEENEKYLDLIKAAPKLLEALQDALEAYDPNGEMSEWDFAREAVDEALGVSRIRVVDIFYQDYNLQEDGIPPHWAVKYFELGAGYPDYYLAESYEEALSWAKQHGYKGENKWKPYI